MSNRCKAAVLIGILSFYILLSALDSVEYSQTSANNESKDSNFTNSGHSTDETLKVGDRVVNLTQFLDDPMVKAFKDIHQIEFIGDWEINSAKDFTFFNKFENPTGKITMEFSNDFISLSDWNAYGKSRNSTVKMVILDGKYYDNQMYIIEFTEPIYTSFNISTLDYTVFDKEVRVFEADKLELKNFIECKINLTMSLHEIIKEDKKDKKNDYQIIENAPVILNIKSNDANCSFEITSTLHKDTIDKEKKTINYSVLLTFMAIINLYSIAKMIKQSIDAPAQASQLSLLTLGFILIWDTYICLSHLYLALSIESLFHFFIMPTFWYFILFSIFEMKLLVIAWKTRYWNQFQNQEQARRGLASFYLKLYLGMIVILFLLYKFILYNWFILIMSLYLVPQIIHNTMRGGRIEFDINYMFLVIGLRALLPLYFRGCPYNMMKLKPSFPFCVALILVIGIQILIIYYQSILGSKFFIPARFLPKQYDYLFDLPEDLESGIEFDDCAVCMNPLHQQSDISTTVNPHARMVLNRLKPEKGQVMKTPCNHKFHVTCLVEWMSIKMECPTCRAALPVLE